LASRKAIVVGSGPNGLAAAITLARAGLDVVVHEAAERVGGGLRTEELTLPGFRHDVCSAIHPLARSSAFFRELELDVDWIESPAAVAHPLDDEEAVLLVRSVEETADGLGADAGAYRRSLRSGVSSSRYFSRRLRSSRDCRCVRCASSEGRPRCARCEPRSRRRWVLRSGCSRRVAGGLSSPAMRRIRCCRSSGDRVRASRSRC
jgi:phytoene dehydrogenase-like protein